jgi:glutamate synthase (NADPH) large chain
MNFNSYPEKQGLYNPLYEHDACGIGAIANIKGIKSHKLIEDVLDILVKLEHRGGAGAEKNTGDGAGILIQLPHKFFKTQHLDFEIGDEGDYAVAQLFLSKNEANKEIGKKIFLEGIERNNIDFLGFREVPTNQDDLGGTAVMAMPYIVQAFVKRPKKTKKGIDFERLLYLTRREIEKSAAKELKNQKFYICSFSSKTIVYKGMLLSTQVGNFYLDLKNTNMESAIGMVHSRFSTNTFPSWERAHPNRFMIHNGEINTIRGNANAIKSREGIFKSPVLKENLDFALPVIAKEGSDSAMFDNTLEFLMMNGRNIEEAIMMMIPEPWTRDKSITKEKRDFYEYHSTMMEPWDGPASIVFTDGTVLGATLDRNGLRPSRYYLTKDDHLIISSETGAFSVDEANVLAKQRLEPGKILLVDTKEKKLISDNELKEKYAKEKPYHEWNKNIIKIENIEDKKFYEDSEFEAKRIILQQAFGYNYEDINAYILPMSKNGEEALAAMGYDAPLAVLSNRPQMLYSYFKQQFAQVTNPPIDAIREEIITSLRMYIGKEGNLLDPSAENAKRIKINSPIITNEEINKLKSLEDKGFKSVTIPMLFDAKTGDLKKALDDIFVLADKAIEGGASIIILSDRGINENNAAVPALLASSALHQYLIRNSRRTHVSIVVESGEPREIHHFACLIGFGATAINPYLAFNSIQALIEKKTLDIEYQKGVKNYVKAVNKGIIKIISKMGLSTIQSYGGAQIFECLGISKEVIDLYFTNTQSSIDGITLEEISKETLIRHRKAFDEMNVEITLDSEGSHKYRANKEEHLYNPLTIYKLQNACRQNDYKEFKDYSSLINNPKKPVNIRDLLTFDFTNEISIDEVESVESIVKRFKTGAMSYGSISEEAHECLAIAMNRINGKSNTGEGGENPERFVPLASGDSKSSAIKQVASGRFGVTMEYLTNAKEIQIKMAQGAKPGEGGQLPAKKVYPWIAKARHSTPGVALISPPPHHDIYSIEDLAQLIYDLKNANRDSRISVKLVSEAGVGTIASGVAKAGANVILISGYDGGTGASPRTSIKNAGMPWEVGLAETHQTLVLNKLRDRVIVETDGKLMSGHDLAVATLLGAEEFGFATAPLIVMGCVMMRVCDLDTCPVGVATQNQKLRGRFKGKPEHVVNFMHFMAQELREYMAKLGFKTIDEMIGRTDKLIVREIEGWKAKKISLDNLLYNKTVINKTAVHFKDFKSNELENTIDMRVLLPLCKDAIKEGKKADISVNVTNVNRTFGTILSSEVTKHHGAKGLAPDTIHIKAIGNAGNSFGAFVTNGISLEVVGDANDYLGKGLCGGRISVYPNERSTFDYSKNIIVGNVTLYGATSGEVYLDGLAGERFAVRNSGASAVLLGVGQHGCEYMTGGRVVILGEIGRNFAAGMSGGYAYVYDIANNRAKVNTGMAEILDLNDEDAIELKHMITDHIKYTNSTIASNVLYEFDSKKFFKVMPTDYKRMVDTIKELKNDGYSDDDAKLEAFHRNSSH